MNFFLLFETNCLIFETKYELIILSLNISIETKYDNNNIKERFLFNRGIE